MNQTNSRRKSIATSPQNVNQNNLLRVAVANTQRRRSSTMINQTAVAVDLLGAHQRRKSRTFMTASPTNFLGIE